MNCIRSENGGHFCKMSTDNLLESVQVIVIVKYLKKWPMSTGRDVLLQVLCSINIAIIYYILFAKVKRAGLNATGCTRGGRIDNF